MYQEGRRRINHNARKIYIKEKKKIAWNMIKERKRIIISFGEKEKKNKRKTKD